MAERIRAVTRRADRVFASLTGRHVSATMAGGWAAAVLLAAIKGDWESTGFVALFPVMLLVSWHALREIGHDMAHPEIRAAREAQPSPPPPGPSAPWRVRLWYHLTVPPPRFRGDPAGLDVAGHADRILAGLGAAPGGRGCRVCGCTDGRPCRGGCWWTSPGLCSNCDALVPLIRVAGDGPFAAVLLVTPGKAVAARMPVGGEFEDPASREEVLTGAGRRFAADRAWQLAGHWQLAGAGYAKVARVAALGSAADRGAVGSGPAQGGCPAAD